MLSSWASYISKLLLGGMYDIVRKIVSVGPARDTQINRAENPRSVDE